MILNSEQLSIVYSEEKVLLVEALAGTGKTTTLMHFASERFSSNVLYLVFNKSMKKESRKKFPSNTEVHTVNSFAFKYIEEILNKPIISDFKVNFVINNIDSLRGMKQTNYNKAVKIAVELISILKNFLNSNISKEQFFKDSVSNLPFYYAGQLYEKMISKENNIPVTHNVVLKYFLDNFDFSKFNYDYILIDEAQDINPPMFNIINKMTGNKVFVGDIKQSIYGFRNTINVFQNDFFEGVTLKRLTGSYRFGSDIAEFINKVTTNAYKSEFNITGLSKDPGSLVFVKSEVMEGPYTAYISRTNAHLFDKAFEFAEAGKKVSIPFDWEFIKQQIEDIFFLKIGLFDRIESEEIKEYASYQNLKNVFEEGGDIELRFLIKIIEKYEFEILEKIKILERQLAAPSFADKIFLTAHKSKGLEFFNVEIGSDFPDYKLITKIEERNLIYVALTRAMEKLKPNEDILSSFLS